MKNNAANLCERRIFPDGELVLAEPVAGDQLLVVRVPHDARHLVIHIQDIIDVPKLFYYSLCLWLFGYVLVSFFSPLQIIVVLEFLESQD